MLWVTDIPLIIIFLFLLFFSAACKRKEQEQLKERSTVAKKRFVFTDLQRRTLIAIYKENKRPSKEMQLTIAQQLGLELSTVSNFFMNARRRCTNHWYDGSSSGHTGTSNTNFSKAWVGQLSHKWTPKVLFASDIIHSMLCNSTCCQQSAIFSSMQ